MPLLASISDELERQAAKGHRTSLLISSVPEDQASIARIDTIYNQLATEIAFVAALAVGLSARLRPGLRGVSIRRTIRCGESGTSS
jgi:hypothetical protein